jgi:hypothetical protein
MADVSDSGWSPQPVFALVNEYAQDVYTWVSSSPDPKGDTFEVELQVMTYPSPGPQTVYIELRATDANAPKVTVLLVNGTTILTAWAVAPTTTFTVYALQVPDGAMLNVLNYSDLRIRVVAGPIVTTCCPNGLPFLLTATVQNQTGCACLDGVTFSLLWNPRSQVWSGVSPRVCGGKALSLVLSCPQGGSGCAQMILQGQCGSSLLGGTLQSCSCSPASLVYTVQAPPDPGGCCSGSFTVTLTG